MQDCQQIQRRLLRSKDLGWYIEFERNFLIFIWNGCKHVSLGSSIATGVGESDTVCYIRYKSRPINSTTIGIL